VTYSLSPNRVKISKVSWTQGGYANTSRRCRTQFMYVVPPFAAAYLLMQWAEEKYELLLLLVQSCSSMLTRFANVPGTIS
jgi:ubiquinol-cytochrome c reductase subunit 8